MSGTYEMIVVWQKLPGYPRDDIRAVGPSAIVAATLKQLCDYPSQALNALDRLEVKRS